jgi:hypothetical protein
MRRNVSWLFGASILLTLFWTAPAQATDSINSSLLSYLGIASGTTFQFVGSVIAANFSNPGAYNGGAFDITALSTDFATIVSAVGREIRHPPSELDSIDTPDAPSQPGSTPGGR